MFAATAPRLNRIYFLGERPVEPGLEIQEDVSIEPLDIIEGARWPDGTRSPEQVLCRSKADPRRYKEFKYRSDFDPDEFEDVGKRYGGIRTPGELAEILGRVDRWGRTVRALAETTDETDTDEVWGQVLHNLGVGRAPDEGAAR